MPFLPSCPFLASISAFLCVRSDKYAFLLCHRCAPLAPSPTLKFLARIHHPTPVVVTPPPTYSIQALSGYQDSRASPSPYSIFRHRPPGHPVPHDVGPSLRSSLQPTSWSRAYRSPRGLVHPTLIPHAGPLLSEMAPAAMVDAEPMRLPVSNSKASAISASVLHGPRDLRLVSCCPGPDLI